MPLAEFSRRSWLLALLGALGFLFWSDVQRARRADFVTSTDAEERQIDVSSPTGYTGGKRWLIVPEHNNRSYEWLAETQQMLARGDWRLRHVDYENAPQGRPTRTASLYRWWIGLLAKIHHAWTGDPVGVSVERAALLVNPLLHALFLGATAVFVARSWGSLAATVFCIASVALYPLASAFLPGVPDDHALAWILGCWSVLPLIAAIDSPDRRSGRLFVVAGVIGGVALWLNAGQQLTFLVATWAGALLTTWFSRKTTSAKQKETIPVLPWRVWGLAGATTSLVGYLIEYFPAHLDFQLGTNHPMYGLAWLGGSEVLAQLQATRFGVDGAKPRRVARTLLIAVSLVAMAALPVAMHRWGQTSFFASDEYSSRLTFLLNGPVAQNFARWIGRDGPSAAALCALAPIVLLLRAAYLLISATLPAARRRAIVFIGVASLVALLYAGFRIREWNTWDTFLLALLPLLITPSSSRRKSWATAAWPLVATLPGLLLLTPASFRADRVEFSLWDAQGLIERQLAHWIADHAGKTGAVVFLPPERTTSWCFHGGFKGIGSAHPENREGLSATVRIATATSADEAYGLLGQRGVTHLVLPSWDHDLDEFARWSLANPEDAFIMALHHWALPPWLQAFPYRMPQVPGFESQSVVILKVTDETNRVASFARLAEYFVESEHPELANSIRDTLRRYPTDLNALIALCLVNKGLGDAAELAKSDEALVASVASGADRSLAWDRRVSLAVALTQAGKPDLARAQVQRCLERVNEERIRSLTTGSLYRLLVLSKSFDLPFPDAKLRALGLELLPKPLRERL